MGVTLICIWYVAGPSLGFSENGSLAWFFQYVRHSRQNTLYQKLFLYFSIFKTGLGWDNTDNSEEQSKKDLEFSKKLFEQVLLKSRIMIIYWRNLSFQHGSLWDCTPSVSTQVLFTEKLSFQIERENAFYKLPLILNYFNQL